MSARPQAMHSTPPIAEDTTAKGVDPRSASSTRIGRWAKKESASALSDYSHKNIGWQLAWAAGLGQSHPAQKVDLHIAMQQIMERDPWLDEEPTSEVEQAFAFADSEPGTVW